MLLSKKITILTLCLFLTFGAFAFNTQDVAAGSSGCVVNGKFITSLAQQNRCSCKITVHAEGYPDIIHNTTADNAFCEHKMSKLISRQAGATGCVIGTSFGGGEC